MGRRGTLRAQNVLKEMVKTALRFVHVRAPRPPDTHCLAPFRPAPAVYLCDAELPVRLALADDARLFVTTFVGGLLFMTVYLA